MHPSRQISRGLLLRAKAAPLQARRHAFFNSLLVCCPINSVAFAVGQLAVFQGASEAPISGSYGSSEQRRKTANWPRPGGLR